MTLVELHSIALRIVMAKDLFRLTFLAWLMMFTTAVSYVFNEYDVTYGCDLTYGTILETVNNIRSITECCLLCNVVLHCRSVKYDRANSECHLNSNYRPLDGRTCPVRFGFAEMHRESNLALIRDYCTITDDCSTQNSECTENKCLCKAGYSYKKDNESCVTSCDVYGSTFTRHPGQQLKKISTNDYETIVTPILKRCKQGCIEYKGFQCLSFDYVHQSWFCNIRNYTELRPGYYEESKTTDHYQRNCK